MKKDTTKINFFKKIYYSMFKIKEYGNLTKEGLKRSIYYVMDVLLILSLIYGGIIAAQSKKNADNLKAYLEENIPEITYLDGVLTSENEETVILDDKLVKINFGGQIVIDTKTDYDTLINKYKQMNVTTILLTADKYTTINTQGKIAEYSYNDVFKQYLGQEIKAIDKEELLYLFDNISYPYYFITYALSYCIAYSLLIFTYTLVISIVVFIVCKIKKIVVKFKEIYSMGLYAMTIPILIHFVINFIPSLIGMYIRIISIIIAIIYLIIAIYITKWITPELSRKK